MQVNFPAVTFCPDFLPYMGDYLIGKNPELGIMTSKIQFYRFERHSGKIIDYESQENTNETVNEEKFGKSYIKILNGIEKREIDPQMLELKV